MPGISYGLPITVTLKLVDWLSHDVMVRRTNFSRFSQCRRSSAVFWIHRGLHIVPAIETKHLSLLVMYTLCLQNAPFIFWITRENDPIFIIFGVQNPEEILHQNLINSPTSPE